MLRVAPYTRAMISYTWDYAYHMLRVIHYSRPSGVNYNILASRRGVFRISLSARAVCVGIWAPQLDPVCVAIWFAVMVTTIDTHCMHSLLPARAFTWCVAVPMINHTVSCTLVLISITQTIFDSFEHTTRSFIHMPTLSQSRELYL